MSELIKKGIIKKENKSSLLFDSLIDGSTFLTFTYDTPQDYISRYWQALMLTNQHNLYGKVFEYIIDTLLFREGLRPFYTQAQITSVPGIKYDVLFFNKLAPCGLWLKSSLNDGCKLADLEAVALGYAYRRAKSYLLTMDTREANVQKAKILSGDMMGLDAIIDCNSDDINILIENLKKCHFTTSVKIDAVEGNLIA